MTERFPSRRLRAALALYGALWALGLPLALVYLGWRGRKDKLYARQIGERFGLYPGTLPGSVWVHAVSLGEMRSALPLIRALIDRGEHVVTTHFTPAGRREAERALAAEIAAETACVIWVPFEFGWTFRRFFRAFRPKYGLVMEIEIWPRLIMAARAAGVPLLMCNAQYPSKSYARDTTRTPLRAELMRGFAGALVKSDLQRDRFTSVGVPNIAVTGELRFAQPVPPEQVAAARTARSALAADRPVVLIASAVFGEDAVYLDAIARTRAAHAEADRAPPLFLYVPRAPERFAEVGRLLRSAGLATADRSALFDDALAPRAALPEIDVLLGDSLGEMAFYIAMADRVVVGGGFTPKGAHNIIEPLAQGKPVFVGPETWTIEYPAEEAIAAGVCRRVEAEDLADALTPDAPAPSPDRIAAFLEAHAGAVEKTLDAIPRLLDRASR